METTAKRSSVLSLLAKNLIAEEEISPENVIIEHDSNKPIVSNDLNVADDFSGQLKQLLTKEFSVAQVSNNNLDRIEKQLTDPDFMDSMAPSELIALYDVLSKRKQNSDRFITSIYKESNRSTLISKILGIDRMIEPLLDVDSTPKKPKNIEDIRMKKKVMSSITAIMGDRFDDMRSSEYEDFRD